MTVSDALPHESPLDTFWASRWLRATHALIQAEALHAQAISELEEKHQKEVTQLKAELEQAGEGLRQCADIAWTGGLKGTVRCGGVIVSRRRSPPSVRLTLPEAETIRRARALGQHQVVVTREELDPKQLRHLPATIAAQLGLEVVSNSKVSIRPVVTR